MEASTSSSQDPKEESKSKEETEEGEDSEEDSEEEEEDEPKLKYERISGDLREILKRDGASCIKANSKVMSLLILHVNCNISIRFKQIVLLTLSEITRK